ncbi:hypothetical protein JOQ06_017084, partial [Pogonophryne albipinna]
MRNSVFGSCPHADNVSTAVSGEAERESEGGGGGGPYRVLAFGTNRRSQNPREPRDEGK